MASFGHYRVMQKLEEGRVLSSIEDVMQPSIGAIRPR